MPYAVEDAIFVAAMLGPCEPDPEFAPGVAAQRLVEAAYDSARRGVAITGEVGFNLYSIRVTLIERIYSESMIDFELSEEQQMIRDTVGAFARDEVRPAARPADERARSRRAGGEGLGVRPRRGAIPEQFGGDGDARSAVTGAVIAEELGFGDLSIALDVLAPRLFAFPLIEMGTDQQSATCRVSPAPNSPPRPRP